MSASDQVVLGIDFGTSNTVATMSRQGRPARVLSVDGAGWMPSAVYLDQSGQLLVGRDAERRARLAPERFEPNPKRRIDDGEVMLGDVVVPVVGAIAAVLRRIGEEARRQNDGRAADVVTLTHPAYWGSTRRNILQSAARQADLGAEVTLLPEPVAAAVHFAGMSASGANGTPGRSALAVYDLGGGTFDCAVVTNQDGVYRVAAADGLADVGGVDFDQALLDQLGRSASGASPARWRALLVPTTPADRRAARALQEDVRTAKESLSRYPQAEIPLPAPLTDALLSRVEFEGLIRPMVIRTVEVLAGTIERSGFRAEDLRGIYLVGGSSRIPLVGQQIAERIGVVPTTLDQPETIVALGAAAWPEVQRRSAPPTAAYGPASGRGAVPSSAEQTIITPRRFLQSPPGPPPGGPAFTHPALPGRPASGAPPAMTGPNGPSGPIRPAAGPLPGAPGNGSNGGWPAPVGTPSRSHPSRTPVIAVSIAVVLALVATAAILVFTGRSGDRGSGGSTGPITTQSSPATDPSTTRNSVPSSSSGIDPATCAGDKDDRGLTACMRSFGGGLLTGAACTTDPRKLDVDQQTVDYFGAMSVAWSACFTSDRKYLGILFNTTNTTARDSLWTAFGPGQFAAQKCGTYLGGGSRGWYMSGPANDDKVPTIVWEDTGLPLIGLARPPGSRSTISVTELVSDFAGRSGFSLDEQDCSKIVPEAEPDKSNGSTTSGSTAPSSTASSSTAPSTTAVSGCPATPLDENHMSPCVRSLVGNAVSRKALCFTSGQQLEQLEQAGAGKTASSAACSFLPSGLVVVAVYLQFKDVATRDAVFASLAGTDTRTTWSQGGHSGAVAAGMAGTATARITWAFGSTPVLVLGTAETDQGTTLSTADLQSQFRNYWKTELLPQG